MTIQKEEINADQWTCGQAKANLANKNANCAQNQFIKIINSH